MGSLSNLGTSPVAHWQGNLPAMDEPQEMRVQSLGLEDPWRRACNPLQYSCLENPIDRRAWWSTPHWVAKSQTWLKRLSMYTHANLELVLQYSYDSFY